MKKKSRIMKQTKRIKERGYTSYSESGKALWFCCALKLGFLQLMWKAFKWNLELPYQLFLKKERHKGIKAWIRYS